MNTEAIATAGDPKKAYEAQLQCFDEYRTRHPRIVDAIKEIKTVAHPTSGIPIINLVGPTGVGKSAAAELIENIMTEEAFQFVSMRPPMVKVIFHGAIFTCRYWRRWASRWWTRSKGYSLRLTQDV